MTREDSVKQTIKGFLEKAIMNINDLSAEELINNSAINPFLVKALDIKDIDSFAKFYVYQRVGRSVVTSFGTAMEHMVRDLCEGKKTKWWDVIASIDEETCYMSVKSGPNDMDKDQVEHFADRAKELEKTDQNALPVIAMCYGKQPWSVISDTLKKQGFDAKNNTLTGKQLYAKITGAEDYHKTLLKIIGEEASRLLKNQNTVNLIDLKVKEISEQFKKKYKDLDELLIDTF